LQTVHRNTSSGVHFFPSGSDLTYKALGAKLYALALSSAGASPDNQSLAYSNLGTVMGVIDTYDMLARLRVDLGAAGQDMYLIGALVESD
jgi:hypothetical protein